MADCIYNLPKIDHTKKKLFKSVQIYRKVRDCSENYLLAYESFFCATFSFLDMVDFNVCGMYAKD